MDASRWIKPLLLTFEKSGLETQYVTEASKDRWPVLIAIFCFDLLAYTIRLVGRMATAGPAAMPAAVASIIPQLVNMGVLYLVVGWINRRSRKSAGKPWAAFQEEVLLSLVVALAICALLVNLGEENAKDYTFGCFFLICTTLLLRLRWLVGTTALSLPLLLLYGSWLSGAAWPAVLPADADVHLTVAWAAGALLSYTIESQKRKMFLAAELARSGSKYISGSLGHSRSSSLPACQRQCIMTVAS